MTNSRPACCAVSGLQVLVIDTEGFDYEVLKQIPFERLRPAVVLWERKHLYARKHLAADWMRRHCYAVKWFDVENDIGMSLLM